MLGISIVSTDSATTQCRRGDFGAVEAALRACEADKRALPIARQILEIMGEVHFFWCKREVCLISFAGPRPAKLLSE